MTQDPTRTYGPAFTPQPAQGPEVPQQQQPADMQGTTTRAFGPMQPVQQPPADNTSLEDRIVARILAATGHAPVADAGPAPTNLSEEDQRLITALASTHPTGRDVRITNRESLAGNLYFVEYAYTPSTGARQEVKALVYDNGKDKTHVFGAAL